MTLRTDLDNLGKRLTGLASRLEDSARRQAGQGGFRTAWQDLRHLFSHGVTGENLRDMFRRDVRDTFEFYTREIDFDSMRSLPAWKRWPFAAWRGFTAAAYRLSPPRRVAFAIAAFASIIGALQFLRTPGETDPRMAGAFWWGVALVLFVLLLLMEVRDKLDLKGDLEVAREIQLTLVPAGACERGRLSIYSFMRTANTVGGDYHDIIDLGLGRISVIVGDVAGKGMPAALLMALLQGSLRTLITAGLRGPELMTRLNQYLCDNIPANRMITLFYAEIDTATGALAYVNAGHNPPLVARSGGALEPLEATSVVLGAFRDVNFESRETRLEPGERLLLYTDGVTEAWNSEEQEYGAERLRNFLAGHPAEEGKDLVAAIVSDVLGFSAGTRLSDDMTLVSIRLREAGGSPERASS